MARPVTYRMAHALRNGFPRALLADMEYSNKRYHFWTGIGALSYARKNYVGLGKLANVTGIKYTGDLAIQDVSFQLSGVEPDDLRFLVLSFRNKTAQVYLACFDEGEVVADPLALLDCEL